MKPVRRWRLAATVTRHCGTSFFATNLCNASYRELVVLVRPARCTLVALLSAVALLAANAAAASALEIVEAGGVLVLSEDKDFQADDVWQEANDITAVRQGDTITIWDFNNPINIPGGAARLPVASSLCFAAPPAPWPSG